MFPILGLGAACVALAVVVANYPLAMEEMDGPVHPQAMAPEPPPARQMALLPARDVEAAPLAEAATSAGMDDKAVIAGTTIAADAQVPEQPVSQALPVMKPAPSRVEPSRPVPTAIATAQAVVAPARPALAGTPAQPVIREKMVARPTAALPATSTQVAVADSNATMAIVQRDAALPVAKTAAVAVASPVVAHPAVDRPVPAAVARSIDAGTAASPALPASASAATPRLPINDRVAFGLVQKFRRAYNDGNLEQVMALFAREARHADGGGRQAIIESFRREFESRARARITVGRPDWRVDGQQAVVVAAYRAHRAGMPGPDGQESSGNLRFELRQEDGELRIALVQPHRF